MLSLIISSIYLILPSYFANMCPVLFKWVPFGGKPISVKLFGSHKTWRGFYTGYLGALLILYLQFYLQKQGIIKSFTFLDYQNINIFLYAFAFGIGAIVGDTLKSFIKRRIGIGPGQPWIPFDQLDFVVFALIFLAPFYIPPLENILAILIITPFLHFLMNFTAYLLKLKKVWW